MQWLGTIATTVLASSLTLFVSWVTEFTQRFDYPPERAGLALDRLFRWEERTPTASKRHDGALKLGRQRAAAARAF